GDRTGAGPESMNTDFAWICAAPRSWIPGWRGAPVPRNNNFSLMASGLSAELYEPGAVEAVDSVVLAEMAGQSPQISLRGNPFGILPDLVWTNLPPLDRYAGVEQR